MAKKKDTKVKIERTYNIPLRSSFRNTAKHKKTPKAMRAVKEFLIKHMKTEEINLGMHLNEYLWKHGIKNPPHHVAVDVVMEDGVAKAELKGQKFKGAVKIEKKKEEPSSMKEKLAKKLGVDDVKGDKAEDKVDEKKAEAKKVETKPVETKEEKAPAKDSVKKEAESKPEVKKEAPKAKAPETESKDSKSAQKQQKAKK